MTYTIEELLGSRSRVAVLRVLHGVMVPLNASQIAVRARLTRHAVATVLADFASMGVVHNSPVGRATVHWLNRDNVYVERLIDPVFQAERQMPDDLIDNLRAAFQGTTVSELLHASPQLAASIRSDGAVVSGSSPWEWIGGVEGQRGTSHITR